MAFDVACDLGYTVGINWFCLLHAFDFDAIFPVDIVSCLSLLSPCLRALSVVRTLEKASWATMENVGTEEDSISGGSMMFPTSVAKIA
jgi:hypothetical protein